MHSSVPRLLERTPAFVRKQALAVLFQATARAFRREMPALRGLSREECLLAYASFTADCAEEVLRDGATLSEVQTRLHQNAYRLGRMPGRLLWARDVADVMALSRFLYSILDIDFVGSASGEITIGRCYFSRFYSPEVCRVMSAMDRGLLAGVAGRGDLVFVERITEGAHCCRARFTLA